MLLRSDDLEVINFLMLFLPWLHSQQVNAVRLNIWLRCETIERDFLNGKNLAGHYQSFLFS